MSNLYPLLCLVALIGLPALILGLLFGFLIKNSYQYRLMVNQNRGESYVRNVIVSKFHPPNFHLLNNVTLPFQDGTTQIDHILISTKGIFVIETKDYSGWIIGDETSGQWTQVRYSFRNKFQNPLHQNYRHIKAVQQHLEFLPKQSIHSIVVFSGRAEFKSGVPKGVVYLSDLISYLEAFQDDTISINRLHFCVGRLECKRYEITKATDIQHRAYLAKKFGDAT
jgi:hypothetical protein